MWRLLTIGVLMFALGALSFAHGGAEHVMGKVKAITSDSITVLTKTNAVKTIGFDASTKFIKSGEAATVKDLKVGDRVVIEVHEVGNRLQAAEVRFGKMSTASTTQQFARATLTDTDNVERVVSLAGDVPLREATERIGSTAGNE